MSIIMGALLETPYGLITLGVILFIALIVELIRNKPDT